MTNMTRCEPDIGNFDKINLVKSIPVRPLIEALKKDKKALNDRFVIIGTSGIGKMEKLEVFDPKIIEETIDQFKQSLEQ